MCHLDIFIFVSVCLWNVNLVVADYIATLEFYTFYSRKKIHREKMVLMQWCDLVSVCLLRFSQQPLNRSLWNLTGVLVVVPERQLSILVSIGCIISDLSLELCIYQGNNLWRQIDTRNRNCDVTICCLPWFLGSTSNKDFILRQKRWQTNGPLRRV